MQDKLSKLKELVLLFGTNISQYKSQNYDEANLRVDFADKFFEILDWDVRNTQGFAENYRDVVREDKLIISGKPKAPDYSFRIGGHRKFFVETKRPFVNIKEDNISAFQIRRYGYTAKLPLCILTDFEEFAVYDTRIKPAHKDSSSTGRIFYCTFDEYEKHFEFIYSTFSKNAILKGSFDKYISDKKNKKGTSEFDKEFLKLIEGWRTDLAKNIAKNNLKLNIDEVNFAVQKIINRIIFLRIAEDRHVEDYETLLNLTRKQKIYKNFSELCIKADTKYNSQLFYTEDFLKKISINDDVLTGIIEGLYYPECPYEFSVMEVEILGNIYEQFLGKVIRLTESHHAKVEEKPEVRKAGGVYYTPQYIVDYIVENTVGEKIKSAEDGKKPKEIESLRILDPACGSGSFLIGAYSYLMEYHLKYYLKNENLNASLKNGKIYQVSENNYKLTIEEKRKILLNNIYGVDIDSQAVEVTKLSLLLKLMENENQESVGALFKYSDLKVLPDLSNNIKCGNSLIGTDFYSGQDLGLFENKDMKKVNAFDWDKEFPEIFKNGGFDVVIGNPPYVNAKTLVELFENERKYLDNSKNFKTLYQKWDLYLAFIEKGLNLLRKSGLFSMIIPHPFINQLYSKILRKHIIENFNLKEISDLSDAKIFKDAIVSNCIIIIANTKPSEKFFISKIKNNRIQRIGNLNIEEIVRDHETYIYNTYLSNRVNISGRTNKALGDFCFISIGMVLNADEKRAKGKFKKDDLISEVKSKIHIKKYVEAKDIERYNIKKTH
jgi:type I restriction-modification system DNA methylase subunit